MLRHCITTNGGSDNYHYSGARRYTVRELSYLQTFPEGYRFAGSTTQATRQVGNACPPTAAEALFLSCAQMLEAHDHRFIGAEDDVHDLYDTLVAKGIQLPPQTQEHARKSLFDSGSRLSVSPSVPLFRYLDRLDQTPCIKSQHDLWGRTVDMDRPEAQVDGNRRVTSARFARLRDDNAEAHRNTWPFASDVE